MYLRGDEMIKIKFKSIWYKEPIELTDAQVDKIVNACNECK